VTSAELAERTGRARSFGHDLVSASRPGAGRGAVCVSAGIRFAIAQRYPGPWIFHDEVAYSDLGRSLGRTGSLAIRDVPGANGFGVVYPVLIAPAYALFGHVPRAYEAARAINALVMSLAAVPVYLLARVRAATAGAWLPCWPRAPAMAYTTAMMTENAFYPAFTLVVLAMYLALERPTILRQLLVFPAILIAFYTRTQGIVFLPALVTAVVILCALDAWLEPGGRFFRRMLRGLAAYWVTWAVALGGAVLVVLYEHARGRPLSTLLGAYGGVTLFQYHVVPIARWFVYHLGELDFAVGVLPFAAFVYVVTGLLRAERSRPLRVFAAVSVPVVLWFTLAGGLRVEPRRRRIEGAQPVLRRTAVLRCARGVMTGATALLAAGAAVHLRSRSPKTVPYRSLINDNSVSARSACCRWNTSSTGASRRCPQPALGGDAGAVRRPACSSAARWRHGRPRLPSRHLAPPRTRSTDHRAGPVARARRHQRQEELGRPGGGATRTWRSCSRSTPSRLAELFFNASVRTRLQHQRSADGLPQTRSESTRRRPSSSIRRTAGSSTPTTCSSTSRSCRAGGWWPRTRGPACASSGLRAAMSTSTRSSPASTTTPGRGQRPATSATPARAAR
jgi:hypothetical protein